MTLTDDPPVSDRALLDQMTAWRVAQNRAHAARLEAIAAFHDRRVAQAAGSRPGPGAGFFQLTPLRETQAEVAPLLGTSEQTVAYEIDTAADLKKWFPRLWERFRSGRLDLTKLTACLDQLVHLASDEDRAKYATAVQDWFDKHDPLGRTDHGLCTITRERIQRATRYQRLKLPQRGDTETFAQAFKKRRVSLRLDEESGMAWLSSTLAAHDAITADHRLTMIAKKRAQSPGETRTLAQLRVDSLLELIQGTLVVPATTGDLEHHEHCGRTCRVTGDSEDSETAHGSGAEEVAARTEQLTCPLHPLVLSSDTGGPIGGYARPVINVTVPMSTLLGTTDLPGVLSGGSPISADYVRHLALQPGSTWYRMLTDDAGSFVELSTTSYQPTDPILRTTVARDHTCVWPGCRRPAVVAHTDHRVPYPKGETSTENLQPLCDRHHPVKHAQGYSVVRNCDGSYTWTTRHGSTFTTPASEQPVDEPSGAMEQAEVDKVFTAITGPLERAFARILGQRGLP
ncbi:MAG TPA: DUF222 domain-containing protein [Nocardioidaceae bacterium]|nr:DUF222 domain-containing protein [Nocardioidaceae bacterium]